MDRIARILLGGSVDEAYVAGMERSLFAVVDNPLKQLSSFSCVSCCRPSWLQVALRLHRRPSLSAP